MSRSQPLADLLRWYVAMGADEAIGEQPLDRLAPTPAPAARTSPPAVPLLPVSDPTAMPRHHPATASLSARREAPKAAIASAREAAAAARTVAELEAAVIAFE